MQQGTKVYEVGSGIARVGDSARTGEALIFHFADAALKRRSSTFLEASFKASRAAHDGQPGAAVHTPLLSEAWTVAREHEVLRLRSGEASETAVPAGSLPGLAAARARSLRSGRGADEGVRPYTRRCQASLYFSYFERGFCGVRRMSGWAWVARMGRMYHVSVGMM